MKTEDLVAWLAADAVPVSHPAQAQRFVVTLALGAGVALLLMLVFLGPRPDLRQAATLPMFWLKVVFPACLVLAAAVAVQRLGHPGMRLGRVAIGVVAPLAAIWLMSAIVLINAAPGGRSALIWGATWKECPLSIAALSVPALLAAFWAVRQLAPTRARLAGAAAGLFAGAAGALVYALHCPEMEAPFLGVWYVVGMLIPTAAGAMLGPRWLRW